MNSPSLYMHEPLLISSLGQSPAEVFAAVSASISSLQEAVFLVSNYQKIKSAPVPTAALPPLAEALATSALSSRQRRLLRLCSQPLVEVSEMTGKLDAPLLLVTAPELTSNDFEARFVRLLNQQTGVEFFPSDNKLVPYGRAGVFQALADAQHLLDSKAYAHVYIGAADTYFDIRTLHTLDVNQRVACASANNAFVAGEAAVFFKVSLKPAGNTLRLGSPGRALEPGHFYSDQPCMGAGLDKAWKQALAGLNGNRVTTLYSTLNGEHFWARELGVGLSRNSHVFTEDYQHIHPADCLGDTGAAAGALNLALAFQGLFTKNHTGPVLVSGSSDREPRGAVLLAQQSA